MFLIAGCTAKATRVRNADYLPRPHLSISLIDPSVVLVHHFRGAMLFDAQFGIGGEGIYPEVEYQGFTRSLDVYGDGSIVLVPIGEGGRQTTGMFVTLPSDRKFLFVERSLIRQLKTPAGMRVFALGDHKAHNSIAHFPEFEN